MHSFVQFWIYGGSKLHYDAGFPHAEETEIPILSHTLFCTKCVSFTRSYYLIISLGRKSTTSGYTVMKAVITSMITNEGRADLAM